MTQLRPSWRSFRSFLCAHRAAYVVGALAVCCMQAGAQPAPALPAPCPASLLDLPADALYGRWNAQIDGSPGTAVVRLQAHPDYEGVRGVIERPGQPAAQLAGDVDDQGRIGLDESKDGRTISGVWVGEAKPGSCGREIRGTWRDATNDSTHPFVLQKD